MLRATLQRAGDKYKVLMREDPEAEEQDARGGPRIAFEVMPTAVVQSPEPPGWQRIAAGALLLFTAATTLQIGLAANVSRLPKVLLWLWPCCSSLSWILSDVVCTMLLFMLTLQHQHIPNPTGISHDGGQTAMEGLQWHLVSDGMSAFSC